MFNCRAVMAALPVALAVTFLVSCDGNPVQPDDVLLPGTVRDIEGNVYTTVKIGNQEWTVENLRTRKFNDGSPIPKITDKILWDSAYATLEAGYCFYNNTTNADTIKKFGALYNWFAVNSGKLAPAGWHVANDADWDTLWTYLIANGYNYDGTLAENKVAKSMAAQTDWQSDSDGVAGAVGNDLSKNNSSGFTALPGGMRDYDNDFNGIGCKGYFWSASEGGASCSWSRSLHFEFEELSSNFSAKYYGCSVRLVKNPD